MSFGSDSVLFPIFHPLFCRCTEKVFHLSILYRFSVMTVMFCLFSVVNSLLLGIFVVYFLESLSEKYSLDAIFCYHCKKGLLDISGDIVLKEVGIITKIKNDTFCNNYHTQNLPSVLNAKISGISILSICHFFTICLQFCLFVPILTDRNSSFNSDAPNSSDLYYTSSTAYSKCSDDGTSEY